jgi:vanillate O-demethylase ferredoxin subunit
MPAEARLEVRVCAARRAAETIRSLEMRACDDGPLPTFAAGAHIDVMLPCGRRSYSLTNAPGETHRYVIAVHREPDSRGGSRHLCEIAQPGDTLEITAPRNHFALDEDAASSVLIGGGIGITPLMSMIRRLDQIGRPWRLHFAARSRERAAFVDELDALEQVRRDRVFIAFGGAEGGRLDLDAIVATRGDSHFYCCGPAGMLAAFEVATRGLPPERVHKEHFSARAGADAGRGGFNVVLARSGRTLPVPPGSTILQALLAEGVTVPHACKEGVCGTCETTVLEGLPDHRDQVLSARERAANRTMMICCSGARSERLVLEL